MRSPIAAVLSCCLAVCIVAGCSGEKQVEKPSQEKQQQVVTDLNIKKDNGESGSEKKQAEEKDDLETLPFDDDESGKGAKEGGLPSLNGPD